jgi:phosphatidate phosphatase APP1
MSKEFIKITETVKVYHGYGHKENLFVCGHVLAGRPQKPSKFTDNYFSNFIHILKLFFIKPIANARVQLCWGSQIFYTITEADGYFQFEWASETEILPGWHTININYLNTNNQLITSGEGKLFVPNSTQYAFISDIDDTVLISHSVSTGKKLQVMFTKNPRSRKTFADVVKFYNLLALTHTTPLLLNPFFYVSSSEWNLYDDLNEFFKHNQLPKGAFLLSGIKKWYQLLKTGNIKHNGKLMRVTRILKAFPKQKFVLLGDNSQSDPQIYVTIANHFPDQITAIFIRNITTKMEKPTNNLFETIENKAIFTCQFDHTDVAIAHAKSIGLIENPINFEP